MIRCAWARASARFGLATTTSTGVGEPKLITSLTRSPGSNPKITWSARARADSGVNPCLRSNSASQGFTFSGSAFRSRSRNGCR